MSTQEKIIEVRNLYKSFGKIQAVKNLSFEVPPAICFGFLGPNGAGKTTVMKILCGKTIPNRHKDTVISVFGHDPRHNSLAIKARTGIVPQDDNLDVELDVLQNLQIYAKMNGIPRREGKKIAHSLLTFMELEDRAAANIRTLSGGMKRRLIIARALINNPSLIILDEPTTGLDPQVRQLIWEKLRMLKKSGVTILLTTHYMEEAFQIADKIIIMDMGGKIMEGIPKELLRQHMESHVLDIHNRTNTEKLKNIVRNKVRIDESEQGIRYYSNDIQLLEKMAQKLSVENFLLRATNLEDLFIKITGRNLNVFQ